RYRTTGNYEDVISNYLLQLSGLTAEIDDLNNVVPGLENRFRQFFTHHAEFVNCVTQNVTPPAEKMDGVFSICDVDTMAAITAALDDSNSSLVQSLKRIATLTAEKINTHSTL